MSTETSSGREKALRAGAAAAREGLHRSENPYTIPGEDWSNWMDGFDHQTVWLESGRGVYDPPGASTPVNDPAGTQDG